MIALYYVVVIIGCVGLALALLAGVAEVMCRASLRRMLK